MTTKEMKDLAYAIVEQCRQVDTEYEMADYFEDDQHVQDAMDHLFTLLKKREEAK